MRTLFLVLASSAAVRLVVSGLHAHPLDQWQQRLSGVTNRLEGVAFGAGSFVVVGSQGVVLRSVNGLAWHLQEAGLTNDLKGVTFLQNEFFALGDGVVARSINGADWTALRPPELLNKSWYDVIHDGNQFLLCGWESVVLTSNFIHFTTSQIARPRAYTALFRDGNYFLAGEKGDVRISRDGLEWTTVLNDGCYFGKLGFFVDRYFAVGCGRSAAYESFDGRTWHFMPQFQSTAGIISDMAEGGGYMVAIGSFGEVFATSNGQHWSRYSVNGRPPLIGNSNHSHRISYGLESFVVVGGEGGIWQSAAVPGPELVIQHAGSNLTLSWPSHYDSSLETTEALGKLSSWSTITNLPSFLGSSSYVTWPATNPAGYFRFKKR